jgi:hypothetical protein
MEYVPPPIAAISNDRAGQDAAVYVLHIGAPVQPTGKVREPFVRQPIISVHKVSRDTYIECHKAQAPAGTILNDDNRIFCVIENTLDCSRTKRYFERRQSIHPQVSYLPQFFEPLPNYTSAPSDHIGEKSQSVNLPKRSDSLNTRARQLTVTLTCQCKLSHDDITIEIHELTGGRSERIARFRRQVKGVRITLI